ncbi:MAG TPA: thiamine phosphate synthase [Polyangia bacterium]|nr:thiamine phosphate synthase [Polyangia bacterium]
MNSGGAPRLYIVTDRAATGGRPLPAVVRAALAGAVRGGLGGEALAVQLREKDLPARALRELGAELRAITRAFGAALYVNDRVDVALAVEADGVHLTGTSLSPADVRAVAPGLGVAISTHAPSELRAFDGARDEGPRIDFAVFGPIRDTPSKRGYGPPVGLEALRAAAGSRVPVLAIGGLSARDVPALVAAGARGLACIRAVMSAADPEKDAYLLAQALAAAPVTQPHQT